MTGIKADTSKFDRWAAKMLSKAKQADGALQRVVYPALFVGDNSMQGVRWKTEGASEGRPWAPLSSAYAKLKLRKFAKYPGGGRKLLVATNRLLNANIGKPDESGDITHMVMNGVLYVRLGVPYARFVHRYGKDARGAIKRDIQTISSKTYQSVKDRVRAYFNREFTE